MVIVKLEDGTSYLVDTDDLCKARGTVTHKLRDKHDYRSVTSVTTLRLSCINSAEFDGRDLIAFQGLSYKWK